MPLRLYIKHLKTINPTNMSHKPELPVEVVTQIKTNAALRCDRDQGKEDNSFRNGYYSGYVSGATAYAAQLHQAQQENAELRRQNDKLKEQAQGWRPLLEEILNNDYISEDLTNKITKFLYGE